MKKYNTCDPKYYGSGVNNCDNVIKCLRELLDKIKKEKYNGWNRSGLWRGTQRLWI